MRPTRPVYTEYFKLHTDQQEWSGKVIWRGLLSKLNYFDVALLASQCQPEKKCVYCDVC